MRITDIMPLGAVSLVAAMLTVAARKGRGNAPASTAYFFAARFFGLWYLLTAATLLFKLATIGFVVGGVASPLLRANFVPFKMIALYVKRRNAVQFWGNVVALFPFPILLYLNSPETRFRKNVLISIIVTVCIEPLQLLMNVILRAPYNVIDIDDFLLNAVGTALGLLTVRLVMAAKARASRTGIKP
ncbi:MAG: VanZ family protein [Clostridiales Family XIII bacterium]|jgi:glycopeptide antibiotics resistance protein|nr:VanZ family protein [Clostridiales Family XIII bacterium]